MSNKEMPAVEAEGVALDERNSYELAFHVLPTVAEGEVSKVVEALKASVAKDGGEIFDEEEPQRFELAYEVVLHLEGKNRKFKSAYFGWIRFKGTGETVEALNEELKYNTKILRHLLIKLTRVEEENPFRFHEAIKDRKMVTDVEEVEITDEADESAAEEVETEKEEKEEENA